MRLNGQTPHIFSRDPAIDFAQEKAAVDGLNKFYDNADQSGIPFKDGRLPVVWKLLSLSERSYAELTRTSNSELQKRLTRGMSAILDRSCYAEQREAARRGIVGVDNAKAKDGTPLKLEYESTGERMLTLKSLEEVYDLFGPKVIAEIGTRVIDLSEVDPT